MNSKIIKASKEILDLLDLLIPDVAATVTGQLKLLLERAEQDPQNSAITDEIVELLSNFPETKAWMDNKISTDNTRDGTTRGGDRASTTRGGGNTRETRGQLVVEEDIPHLYPVWFGTNRQPNDINDLSKGFSGNRAEDIHAVYYGRCDVAIPETHKFGETGNSWWKRWAKFDFGEDDHLALQRIYGTKDADSFWKALRADFRKDENGQDALIFLHGFNNSFEDAAIRAAQIGFDLKVQGQTAFFSWPSKAKVIEYPSDESTIIASENAITQFLIDFTEKSGAGKVHLIAHSMGNRGLLAALKTIQSRVRESGKKIEFGQIILAAPDLDVDVFKQAKDAYIQLSSMTTIYTSETDKAVSAAEWLKSYPRLGTLPPVTVVEDIDTIEVKKNTSLLELGHSYFADTEALLHDIYDLINHGQPPNLRIRPREETNELGQTYWLIDT